MLRVPSCGEKKWMWITQYIDISQGMLKEQSIQTILFYFFNQLVFFIETISHSIKQKKNAIMKNAIDKNLTCAITLHFLNQWLIVLHFHWGVCLLQRTKYQMETFSMKYEICTLKTGWLYKQPKMGLSYKSSQPILNKCCHLHNENYSH